MKGLSILRISKETFTVCFPTALECLFGFFHPHFNGLAPLLSMLNTCASGVAVVNIDNGFGAGFYAHLINMTGINYLAERDAAPPCPGSGQVDPAAVGYDAE